MGVGGRVECSCVSLSQFFTRTADYNRPKRERDERETIYTSYTYRETI